MEKFKVLKEFTMNGVTHKVGDIIELDYTHSRLSSIQENIEKYDPSATPEPAPSVDDALPVPEGSTPPNDTTGDAPNVPDEMPV